MKIFSLRTAALTWFLCTSCIVSAAAAKDITIAANRSQLFEFNTDMGEVVVANPEIADVYAHGTRQLTIIGKSMGQTTVRALTKDGKVLDTYTVTVGYDLPAIRKALKEFISGENIGIEMVNTKVALTGKVSSAMVADRAVQVTEAFIKSSGSSATTAAQASALSTGSGSSDSHPQILNFLQVASSQQVMLRVRVGEVQRSALKQLGFDWSTFGSPGGFFYQLGIGSGIERFLTDSDGAYKIAPDGGTRGFTRFGWTHGGTTVDTLIKSLESDGLFKLLAEPNLVAISGEEAEFLAGGEIPVPTPQPGSGGGSTITVEYKPFGVSVKFKPYVLTPDRLRIEVQPEVSALDSANSVTISGFVVPALTTRRAKTTVELAPGESFMIAGLLKDETRASVDQLPGVKELPVIGALFRSTEFQRNESELVIAVTPYIVDPVKSADVKLPTDNFVAPTQMDMLFYGNISGTPNPENTPRLEGPAGFMTE